MLFIETEIFTEDVQKLLNDDEFSRFQFFLALNPDYGEVIPETGRLRKVRWVSGGKGKRAGVRVIYFHQVKHIALSADKRPPASQQSEIILTGYL